MSEKSKPCDALLIVERRYGLDTPQARSERLEIRQNMEIGQQIYDLRTAAGLTQAQLAALVGTSGAAISRLEHAGYRGHSVQMLRRIAAALGRELEVRFVEPVKQAA